MTIGGYIESKTGISTASAGVNITSYMMETYINMSIKEIISAVLRLNPGSGVIFSTESDEQDENGFKVESGIVYSVVRAKGASTKWRPAKEVSVDKEYLVTDSNSLFYASGYNPVYTRSNDNIINVFPVPSGSETYKVTYVEYPKYDGDGLELFTGTEIDDIGIKNFPSTFHPHLITAISIKVLEKYYNDILHNDEDIELADAYLKTLKEMRESLKEMFISKELLEGARGQQQPQVVQGRA